MGLVDKEKSLTTAAETQTLLTENPEKKASEHNAALKHTVITTLCQNISTKLKTKSLK